MNRIERTLSELGGKKALITFVTAGDPNLETTGELVLSMLENGADIVEIGVPFSDPVAEGPVIQDASKRALDGGTTLAGIFETVKKIRSKTQAPLLLMLYANSIYGFGAEKFFSLCADSGIDGVIVPDLPFEERGEILPFAKKHGVISISLVAPTSRERIEMIAKEAEGFLYCVSSTGVTGMRSSFSTDFESFFGAIKEYAKIPCAVGFGISGPCQAKEMSKYCDGVIVGSAIVKIVGDEKENSPKAVGEFVKSLRDALDE